MALDGGYYGSHEHAMANLYIGRRQGREQGHEEGYKEGRADGYNQGFNEGYNRAMAEAQQHIQQLQAALNHEVTKGNLYITIAAPAQTVLSALMREGTEQSQRVRNMFLNEYFAEVQDSLNNHHIAVAPEHSPEVANEMPNVRQFLLEALQG